MDSPLPPESLGTHLLLDLYGCAPDLLDDPAGLEALLREAAAAAGAQVVGAMSHRFSPHGASVVCLLAESHISIHTWPEQQTAAVDIYTCGPRCLPSRACDLIRTQLQAAHFHLQTHHRGSPS
ncbi:MAG: adenosylmethionine decarboxylase [Pirellulales bacterium]